ncbi:MAG TPA: hypothetical protein HA232_00500 [Methanocellales archaeon]|jgi:hypothetical protein|nr:hypothetical protein [Methanocellales archaeon]
MALTLRLTETENVLLEKIAIDLREKTQSGAIRTMIASWAARESDFAKLQAKNIEIESQVKRFERVLRDHVELQQRERRHHEEVEKILAGEFIDCK